MKTHQVDSLEAEGGKVREWYKREKKKQKPNKAVSRPKKVSKEAKQAKISINEAILSYYRTGHTSGPPPEAKMGPLFSLWYRDFQKGGAQFS